jgi:malic enzyme
MTDYFERSLALHAQTRGKVAVRCKVPLETRADLSVAYTPGVARPCEVIAADERRSFDLTMRGNSVCVLSDGTAVLGLGDIGPAAAMPVMEGKACLFKAFADIDAIPLCVKVPDGDAGTQRLIEIARAIAPTFGGINLEDIAAPRCFAVEDALQDLGIPVMHDDQHGTAIVLLAAIINAVRVTGKRMSDLKVVINGAGAAGTAIAKILRCVDMDPSVCVSVGDVILCDTKGVIGPNRPDSELGQARAAAVLQPGRGVRIAARRPARCGCLYRGVQGESAERGRHPHDGQRPDHSGDGQPDPGNPAGRGQTRRGGRDRGGRGHRHRPQRFPQPGPARTMSLRSRASSAELWTLGPSASTAG